MSVKKCPICESGSLLPDEKQPQSGTHAYTLIYSCGTEIDYAYSDNKNSDGSVSHKCTNGKKKTLDETMDLLMKKRMKNKWESLTFKVSEGIGIYKRARIYSCFDRVLRRVDDCNQVKQEIKAPELLALMMEISDGNFTKEDAIKIIEEEALKNEIK